MPAPQDWDHKAGSAPKITLLGCPTPSLPPSPSRTEHTVGLSATLLCPLGPAQRQSGTMSFPAGEFHHTSYPLWMGKRLMGTASRREQLPAPAVPPARKKRDGAREERPMWREQHEKAEPLPVVQHSKCHHGFLFCSLSPKQGSRAWTAHANGDLLPSSNFIYSKAKAPQVSQQHPWLCWLVPMLHIGKRELGPKGTCSAFRVTAARSHPTLPPLPGSLLSPR